MDKRILGSIITILILLGVLWVFAAAGTEINRGKLVSVNATGSKNFTASYEWSSVGAAGSNVTLNMSLLLDFAGYTINNISIEPPIGYRDFYELGFPVGTNCSINASGEPGGGGGLLGEDLPCDSYEFSCRVVSDGGGIECTNQTAKVNVSGNSTIIIWFEARGNWSKESKGEEVFKNWVVTVATNATATSISDTLEVPFGVDDLRPRISSINISDGTNTLTGESGIFNTSSNQLLNNSNINITIVINEYNREDVWVYVGQWNGTKKANADNRFTGTNFSVLLVQDNTGVIKEGGAVNMTKNTGCTSPESDSTESTCWYSAVFINTPGKNFTDGTTYTIFFWTNDSFNHEANLTNGWAGYNFTIDSAVPAAVITMPTVTTIYSGRSITVKCEGSDGQGAPNLPQVTIIAPSGKETTRAVDNENHESTFNGITELGEAGLYKVKCWVSDQVGHSTTTESEFRVVSRSVSTGAASAGEPTAKVDISTTETASGTIGKIQGESETFTIDGVTSHRITFLEVGTDYAKLRVESTPVEFTLKVGESKEIEFTEGKTKITLSSIADGKANVVITNIEKYEEKIAEEKAAREPAKGWGTWITLLVIVAVIVIGYLVIKARKGKKGELHFSRHDLGL